MSITSIWEGVYASFAEADGNNDAFDTEMWIQKQLHTIQKYDATEHRIGISKDYPLPLVTAPLLLTKDMVSILDFGGGMGQQYFELISTVPQALKQVEYHVVDGHATIKNRPVFLNNYQNLHFYDHYQNISKIQVDILHIGSTLQYIETWASLLLDLTKNFNPSLIVLSDLMAGQIPSFVCHQNFYDKKIPVMMINIDEITDLIESFGYKTIYRSHYLPTILGQHELPNSALPEKYRFKHPYNIVFQKVTK